jgi:hypothetical protein
MPRSFLEDGNNVALSEQRNQFWQRRSIVRVLLLGGLIEQTDQRHDEFEIQGVKDLIVSGSSFRLIKVTLDVIGIRSATEVRASFEGTPDVGVD